MALNTHTIEGTWEEIAQHASELLGRRVRLIVLDDDPLHKPNKKALEMIRKVSERNKNMPISSDEDTLKTLREGRAGRMFGNDSSNSE